MAIPVKNVLGNPNVTEGNFQIAIEQLRESVIGSGKAYDSANTYMIDDTCVYGGIIYYSKVDSNTGNTPVIGTNWGVNVVQNTGNETIGGIKTFSSSPIVPVPTLVNQAISMGNIIEKTGAGIGYGTGSGGTVTQLTSKATNVVLNKISGQITMHNASLAAGGIVGFQLNNSMLSSTDSIIITFVYDGLFEAEHYELKTQADTGSVIIWLKNTYSTSLSDAVKLKFNIFKGANS